MTKRTKLVTAGSGGRASNLLWGPFGARFLEEPYFAPKPYTPFDNILYNNPLGVSAAMFMPTLQQSSLS